MEKLDFGIFDTKLSVDVTPIVAELASAKWEPHFMKLMADSGNSALLLVTSEGTSYNSDGSPNHRFMEPMLPTDVLNKMPATKAVWSDLNLTGFHRSRFMKIEPGKFMPKHKDINPYWRDKARLHIPIVTDPSVMFSCGPDTLHMKTGGVYLIDNSDAHTVINPSSIARIHLVIDILLSDVPALTKSKKIPKDRPGFKLLDPDFRGGDPALLAEMKVKLEKDEEKIK